MRRDFDCIVIGSGMGGLSAAGTLSADGFKVLLIEQNPAPGGYLQSFRRKGVVFDSSIDCFSGLDENGPIKTLLRSLDVEEEVDAIRIDPIRTSIFPGTTVHVHADMERYVEGLKELFPGERGGIDGVFSALGSIYDDIRAWGEYLAGARRKEAIPENIIRYGRTGYDDLLSVYTKDSRLKAVLSDRCSFYGLSPKKVSAVSMAALMMSYFDSGAYRVKGGSQGLANAIVNGIGRKGGTVLLGTKAESIFTEMGVATGVRTSDGSEYTARCVISAIDFFKTFNLLIEGDEAKQALAQPVHRVSSSFFILYAGIKADLAWLDRSSSIGFYPSFEMESHFGPDSNFRPESSLGVTIPTVYDDTMAPYGMHSITVHEMAEWSYTDSWKKDKDILTRKIIEKAERVIPGLEEAAVHIEAATPATLERYTGNTKGAAYGWEQTTGLRPLKTFIKNLFLAGHWQGLGGGVVAAAYSGIMAAKEVKKVFDQNPARGSQ